MVDGSQNISDSNYNDQYGPDGCQPRICTQSSTASATARDQSSNQRKDCCMNFFRNGFRKYPSTQPQANGALNEGETSQALEQGKKHNYHRRDQSNLEAFMEAVDSNGKPQKAQEDLVL